LARRGGSSCGLDGEVRKRSGSVGKRLLMGQYGILRMIKGDKVDHEMEFVGCVYGCSMAGDGR